MLSWRILVFPDTVIHTVCLWSISMVDQLVGIFVQLDHSIFDGMAPHVT